MNIRRGQGGISGSPVLIGALTVLIVIVAVFLSYNANKGLPFVPTTTLKAEVPNASGLIVGNEVRIGGARVGIVSKLSPLIKASGAVGALIELHLDKDDGPLPSDSTLIVRPRSPLGLKYVEITRGRSHRGFPENATLPLAQVTPKPVEIDEFFGMFDLPTRMASRTNLDQFGNGFAGRGESLNTALRGLNPLVTKLEPVMRNIAAPATRFGSFFPSLEQAAHEVAPVAATQGRLFVSLDRTFGALAGVSEEIKATISGGPPALDVATRELPAQAGFVRDSTELFRRFRPGFRSFASASRDLAPALRTGTPALLASPALNRRLTVTLASLERFAADPRVTPGLTRLTETATLLRPTIAFATPAQTTCNYLGLFFSNLQSALSEADTVGSFLRVGILALPQLPGSEAGPSAAPSNGPAGDDFSHIPDTFLHSNPYPNTAAPGQTRECEAGNETYLPGRAVIGNQPGNQGTASEATAKERR